MNKRTSLQLQVPEPCHQPWSEMNPEGLGRFCMSCTKTVVDFSGYTDEQLIAFFTQREPGRVCGRFSTAQLDRPLQTPSRWKRWIQTIASLLLPLFIQFRADAQQIDSVAQVENRDPQKVRIGDPPIILGITFPSDWIDRQKPTEPKKMPVDPRNTKAPVVLKGWVAHVPDREIKY